MLLLVVREFQSLVFAAQLCALVNIAQVSNLHCSDGAHLRDVGLAEYALVKASGDSNSCRIHSIALPLQAAGIFVISQGSQDFAVLSASAWWRLLGCAR